MSEESLDPIESFINDFMAKMELKGKPTFNKIKDYTEKVGLNFEKVKKMYQDFQKKENFAREIMSELELKGKSKLLKIFKIMDTVGWDKQKIKTFFLRSTIGERIKH
ncbi:MAG: hypothetical protein ACTSR8_03520 [Promethearchaeota archaeon]